MTKARVKAKDKDVIKFWDVAVKKTYERVHDDIRNHGHTHYLFDGGRGSLKSSFSSLEIILGMNRDSMANAVVLRKVRETLADSVFDQLQWAIEILGQQDLWQSRVSPLSLVYKPTGQMIRFRGADKPKKIKSMKFKRGYCKYIWYEELDEFGGPEEIRLINQSLMRGGPRYIVLYSYNPPKSANSWVNTESKLTRKDRLVHHSTYLDVPREWLGEQFYIEAEYLKATKEEAYRHEYLGEIVGSGGQVFPNVQIRPISNEEISTFEIIKRGQDFGFATDPFAYNTVAYDRKHRRLYVFFEIDKTGLSNQNACRLIKEENKRNELIKADSAEPKSIHEMNQYGLKVNPCKKGPDSVDYGIKFLQDLDAIVIDDLRCPETAREFMSYELDRDANGNFKAGYPDRNNHHIDAIRYAMEDEAWKLRQEKKAEKEPGKLTPHEQHERDRKSIVGNGYGADEFGGGW